MKIVKIKLDVMPNELHYKMHKDVYVVIDRRPGHDIEMLDMLALRADYFAAFDIEQSVLDIVTKSKYSREIIDADRQRDTTCLGFMASVKAMLYHFDPAVQSAARRVMDIFDHYGNIPKRSYNEETAAIEDFLRELQRPDLADAITKLGVEAWRDRLDADNRAFEALYLLRYDEKAALPAIRMKEARVETDKRYRNIVTHLEYLLMMNRVTPQLSSLITDINVVVTNYKIILAQKAGRHNKPEGDKNTDNELSE